MSPPEEAAMPTTTDCPQSAYLQPFLLGGLGPDQATELERHLERCDLCLSTLRTLMADDALAEAARREPRADGAEGEAVERLVGRLHRLGPAAAPTAGPPAALTDTPMAQRAPAAGPANVSDLLGPPQGPDEIGRLGEYRVLGVLGSGGMGVVFRAEDCRLRRPVALKAIRPELAAWPALRARFLREARAAAALTHDHIVPVYQSGEHRGTLYLAMALLPGESLEDHLHRMGRLPLPELLRVGREIAEGLAAAHAAGLVHRVVKPANVGLEELPAGPDGAPRRRARLLDFGLARAAHDDAHLTQPGTLVGTPAYLAPEQARGEAVDPRSDLFSLGVVLYRLATGALPFQGKDAPSTLLALARDRPGPPRRINPALPPALNRLILRLLSKRPADRPPSARAVVQALAAVEADLPRRASRPTRRRYLAVAAAALLLAGGVALGVWIVSRSAAPPARPAPRDVERRAAEWVLSAGGAVTVRLAETEQDARAVADLPAEDFRVVAVSLVGTKVGDADLENLRGLPNLARLDLTGTPAGDAGLAHLQGLTSLTQLQLQHTQVSNHGLAHLRGLTRLEFLSLIGTEVSDAGLEHLRSLTNLRRLDLQATRLSDTGLAHLKALPKLHTLDLGQTNVSDPGLAHLKSMTNLKALDLQHTRVGDAGLSHLQGLTNLTRLVLLETRVGDAGLKHLKGLSNLRNLVLFGTAVSDAGLEHLKGLTELEHLDLTGTRVTAAGVAALRKARPKCHIATGPAPK
jgi:hypothetical protein